MNIKSENFYLLTETNTQTIFQEIKKLKPQLVIVDSVQTLQTPFIESSPGSVIQIRESALLSCSALQRNQYTCFS